MLFLLLLLIFFYYSVGPPPPSIILYYYFFCTRDTLDIFHIFFRSTHVLVNGRGPRDQCVSVTFFRYLIRDLPPSENPITFTSYAGAHVKARTTTKIIIVITITIISLIISNYYFVFPHLHRYVDRCRNSDNNFGLICTCNV